MNRLAAEKSPYLLQHAHNPVDWWPWGEAAHAEARRRDVPLFVSIGYATCHWCHVMERESFEDPAVAALLNDAFVPVKVDREERPDVDAVYMAVCQALTGHGGWPLTVVATPDGQPFWVGTYLPPDTRGGRPGLRQLVPKLSEVWRERRDDVLRSAGGIASAVTDAFAAAAGEAPGTEALDRAFLQLHGAYDADHGGFGSRPKFPTPHHLLFLLRHWKQTGSDAARDMVRHTLTRMRLGGLYDHVGGGFHRYSTDRSWTLPHFEKMLYDQALLLMAYAEAWAATGEELFRETTEGVVGYVLRDLLTPAGAFASAEDADSLDDHGEPEEGFFYTWTMDELVDVLGREDGVWVAALFGAERAGNFADEATGEKTGRNILHLPMPLPVAAERIAEPPDAVAARWEAIRAKLFEARGRRARPLLDDKVLADWNGLMIAALAVAARHLGRSDWADAAGRAADAAFALLTAEDGRLRHRWRDGEAALPATLDDHTFLAWGCLELHQTTFEARWLRRALDLMDEVRARYADGEGAFFLTPDDAVTPLARPREFYDGAVPSGNAVAAFVLARLARLTGEAEREAEAARVLAASPAASMPMAHTMALTAALLLAEGGREVVVVGEPGAPDTAAMVEAVTDGFRPFQATLVRPPRSAEWDALAPFTAAMAARDDRAAAYVCRNFACQAPTTDPREAARQAGE